MLDNKNLLYLCVFIIIAQWSHALSLASFRNYVPGQIIHFIAEVLLQMMKDVCLSQHMICFTYVSP